MIAVTNLNDSGPGSLREALEEVREPRIVVFRVSGCIDLKERIRVSRGNLTLAGQSAPGGGICLRHHGLVLSEAENLVIRHIRVRPGDGAGQEMDAMTAEDCENLIIDHCSVSWATDETLTAYHNRNTTVQWCLISESLFLSAHRKGAHGYGGIWGGSSSSWHHNLLAHHSSRNPRFARDEEPIDYRNNVIYNWGFNSAYGGEGCSVNVVANCYIPGPATEKPDRILEASAAKGRWFIEDNLVVGAPGLDRDNWQGGVQEPWTDEAGLRLFKSLSAAYLTTETARQAQDSVLKEAGATLPTRDAVDARIVAEVRSRSARFGKSFRGGGNGIIDTPADVGGWPNLEPGEPPPDKDEDGMPDPWEGSNGLDPSDPSDGPGDEDGDGYTNVEEFLNGTLPRQAVDYTIPKELPAQTVKPAQPAKFWNREIVVSADGKGHFRDLREAIEAAPALSGAPFPIRILAGTYPGSLVIPEDKPLLRLEADGEVILTGTSEGPALQVAGGAFQARGITFRSSGSHPAVVVHGDRAVFRDCQLRGEENALALATGRTYLRECRLEGRATLVAAAGKATAFLDRCKLHLLGPGPCASVPKVSGRTFGVIFSRCVLSAEANVSGVALTDGPPDRSCAAFLEMDLPEFVDEAHRSIWKKRGSKEFGDKVSLSGFLGASDGWNPAAPAVPLVMLSAGPPGVPAHVVGLGGNGHVSLSWDKAENAVSYTVKREKDDASGFGVVTSGLNKTSWIDRAAGPQGTRRYTIAAVSASGQSAESAPVTVPVSGDGLPAPWALTTTGAGTGEAVFANGTLMLRAPETTGLFAWQAVTGEAELLVHVDRLVGHGNGDAAGKGVAPEAGILLQQGLGVAGEGGASLWLSIRGDGRPTLRWQIASGTGESLRGGALGVPCWLKLTRQQAQYRAEVSRDGVSWTAVGETSLPGLAGPVCAGLFLSSGEAVFNGIAFPSPPPPNAEP
ncbi:MAG: Pectinesterase [Verrucomicrobia bacterium]|nr:MAG: Pectinesterase [Verrucomicrobiota bacterium]